MKTAKKKLQAPQQKILYGKETRRAIKNFPISGWKLPSEILTCLALIKEHAATVNGQLKQIPKTHAKAISTAARKVRGRDMSDQFPVDVFQTGSGTSTNMNMNEVLATMASTKTRNIHPNDHVNHCQSSNDVIPTAIQIACALKATDELLPTVLDLKDVCRTKGKEFNNVTKTARTHLMDAVPVRLGDEFAAYAALLDSAGKQLLRAIDNLCHLPLGGTAAGTGLNAHPKFAAKVIKLMAKETNLNLREAKNHIAAQSCPLPLLSLSCALRELSVSINKIANDIRYMGSGPVTGFNELKLPELQAGSSIMPGKVNPVLCESILQVHYYVVGSDATVQAALSGASNFELNTAYPVIAQSLIIPMRLLKKSIKQFAFKCIANIKVNEDYIDRNTQRNSMLVTALTKEIGYDQAAKIAKEAIQKDLTIMEVASKKTDLSKAKLKKLLDPTAML